MRWMALVAGGFCALVLLSHALQDVADGRAWFDGCGPLERSYVLFDSRARGPSSRRQAMAPYLEVGDRLEHRHQEGWGRIWQVVREDRVLGEVTLWSDGHGGWLVHDETFCGTFHPLLGPDVPERIASDRCSGLIQTRYHPPLERPRTLTYDPRSRMVVAAWSGHRRLWFSLEDPDCDEVAGLTALAQQARRAPR